MNDYILVHHGIQGQKWGVRRFQNEDGSLTAEGKERYGEKGFKNTSQAIRSYNRNSRKAATYYANSFARTEYIKELEAKRLDRLSKGKSVKITEKNLMKQYKQASKDIDKGVQAVKNSRKASNFINDMADTPVKILENEALGIYSRRSSPVSYDTYYTTLSYAKIKKNENGNIEIIEPANKYMDKPSRSAKYRSVYF